MDNPFKASSKGLPQWQPSVCGGATPTGYLHVVEFHPSDANRTLLVPLPERSLQNTNPPHLEKGLFETRDGFATLVRAGPALPTGDAVAGVVTPSDGPDAVLAVTTAGRVFQRDTWDGAWNQAGTLPALGVRSMTALPGRPASLVLAGVPLSPGGAALWLSLERGVNWAAFPGPTPPALRVVPWSGVEDGLLAGTAGARGCGRCRRRGEDACVAAGAAFRHHRQRSPGSATRGSEPVGSAWRTWDGDWLDRGPYDIRLGVGQWPFPCDKTDSMQRHTLLVLGMAGFWWGCPPFLCGGGSQTVTALRPLAVTVPSDLNGAPYDEDGTPPELVVTLSCLGADGQTQVVQAGPVEALTVTFPASLGTPACVFAEGTQLEGTTLELTVEDSDDSAPESVTSVLTLRPTSAQLDSGAIQLEAVDHLLALELRLQLNGNNVSVTAGQFSIRPDNNGMPWDRDGSPPDIAIQLSCPPGTASYPMYQGVEGFTGTLEWVSCTVDRSTLLEQGLSLQVLDLDKAESLLNVRSFAVTPDMVAAGRVEWLDQGLTREVVVGIQNETYQYGCD